jgi:hypothetical protein
LAHQCTRIARCVGLKHTPMHMRIVWCIIYTCTPPPSSKNARATTVLFIHHPKIAPSPIVCTTTALSVCFIRGCNFTGPIGTKLPAKLAVFDADHNRFSSIDPAICTSPVPALGLAGGCDSDWPDQPFGTCCLSNNAFHSASSLPSCVVENCGAGIGVCTGSSTSLHPGDCSVWQELYDAMNGPKWSGCSDARSDPCACNVGQFVSVVCKGGKHITGM